MDSEVDRLVKKMRVIWEEHYTPVPDVQWLLAYYPVFAQIAVMLIAEQRLTEAVVTGSAPVR